MPLARHPEGQRPEGSQILRFAQDDEDKIVLRAKSSSPEAALGRGRRIGKIRRAGPSNEADSIRSLIFVGRVSAEGRRFCRDSQ